MVDEVERTDSLPGCLAGGGGGACVEATRFGLGIGNGDGHREGGKEDRLLRLN